MNIAYLLTGSNQQEPAKQLTTAKNKIEECCGRIVSASAVYETEAWGIHEQPSFLNQALKIETALSAPVLLSKLLEVEKEMGRMRMDKYGPRIIDIDILFFNDTVIHTGSLEIPHPFFKDRRFALVPMSEIAPDYLHPELKQTISALLTHCSDPLSVVKKPAELYKEDQ